LGWSKHVYWLMFNMRASFPDAIIFLALADIKACFRFPRIYPDLTDAFGFKVHGLYCLATAMVFGSSASLISWEPIRRAIEALTKVFANRPDLVEKHKYYIDMIRWNIPTGDEPRPVRTMKCALNPGILSWLGTR
jgi:hypothetical protein